MKALWITEGAEGGTIVRPLPLPFRRMNRPLDPEIFRRQARGENVHKPRMFEGRGLRSRRTIGLHKCRGHAGDGRGLMFIISGRVDVSLANGDVHTLGPGDIYFQDDFAGPNNTTACVGDCRLLHLGVADGWSPEGELQDQISIASTSERAPSLRRMYRATDDKSYFRDFGHLFPASGEWSEPRPVVGFHFVTFPSGYFIDWHPEGVNNFVIVTSGGLELEVSGDGAIEVFSPGDICLAEDRTGEGHIDRAHGETRMALIVFEDAALWPGPASRGV
jgi:hypothetical protein